MASDLISREALLDAMREEEWQSWHPLDEVDAVIAKAPAVDSIPIDVVAEMLFDLGGEYPCNYSCIDEWLPEACENIDTCPDVIGKHGCWKQFIKHWNERKRENE